MSGQRPTLDLVHADHGTDFPPGLDAEALARIRSPIGLAIGATTPAEISISILAQLTETLRKTGQP